MRLFLALVVIVGVTPAFAEPVPAPLTMEGVVRDPAGLAIPGVWIVREGHRNSVGDIPKFRSDANGRFRVEDVPEGRAVLRFMPGDLNIRGGKLVETTGGARDLVVVVEPGPSLVAKIAGYVPPEDGRPRWARLTWEEADGGRVVRYTPIRDDGWLRFVRLPKDQDLELWANAASDRAVHEGGLRPGDPEVAIPSQRGLDVRGKVLVAPGENVHRVSVSATTLSGFKVARGSIEDDGTFVVRNLPAGTYRVSACFTMGAVGLPLVREVAAGTTDVVFDLGG
jgi:hypothetical protein